MAKVLHIYEDCKGKTFHDGSIFCADCVERESKEMVYVCPGGGEEEFHTEVPGNYSCGTCGALMVLVS